VAHALPRHSAANRSDAPARCHEGRRSQRGRVARAPSGARRAARGSVSLSAAPAPGRSRRGRSPLAGQQPAQPVDAQSLSRTTARGRRGAGPPWSRGRRRIARRTGLGAAGVGRARRPSAAVGRSRRARLVTGARMRPRPARRSPRARARGGPTRAASTARVLRPVQPASSRAGPARRKPVATASASPRAGQSSARWRRSAASAGVRLRAPDRSVQRRPRARGRARARSRLPPARRVVEHLRVAVSSTSGAARACARADWISVTTSERRGAT
jgi:hypothetical protein